MAMLFEIADPQGVMVGLDRERWQRHVLAKRPWLSRYLPLLKQAIAFPTAMKTDKEWEDALDYYLYGVGRNNELYLMVVVQYETTEAGERFGWVRTAFLVSEISEKGDLI